MNEVRNIHLSRSEFVIAKDAQKLLQDYIEAIKKRTDNPEVINEVEARMAEMLIDDRSINEGKVVLKEDVEYLKSQLGSPSDFDDTKDDNEAKTDSVTGTKQLMRDPRGKLLGGVASGLGLYFSTDAIWFRVIFLALSFINGLGIFIYLVLWLLIPEAKTETDRLAMKGESITLENIKKSVENIKLDPRTSSYSGTLSSLMNSALKLAVGLAGFVMLITGLSVLIACLSAASYLLFAPLAINGVTIFPVGVSEKIVFVILAAALATISILVVLAGLSTIRGKAVIGSRKSGVAVAVFVALAVIASGAFGAVAPRLEDRIKSISKTEIRSTEQFHNYEIKGSVNIDDDQLRGDRFESAKSLSIKAHKDVDLSKIKTEVRGGVLVIDAQQANSRETCKRFCVNPDPVIKFLR